MIKKRQQYDMSEQNESKGMELYEYIVDHVDELGSDPKEIVDQLRAADQTGQFLASTARYLAAIDRERFEGWLSPLVVGATEKDRERRYIGSLLEALWGRDYEERVAELKEADNNFRRIYRRIHPEEDAM